MNERDYQRKPNFTRLVQDLAELVDRLGRVARECLGGQLEERHRTRATD